MQVTPASEWRRRRNGFPFRLPSGLVVRIRAIQFDIVAKTGKVPDFLTPIVDELLNGPKKTKKQQEAIANKATKKMNAVEVLAMERQLKEIVAACALAYPIVVDNPVTDDEISPNDLELADLEFIYQVCFEPADELERFSEEQARGMEPVDNVQKSESTPQPMLGTE